MGYELCENVLICLKFDVAMFEFFDLAFSKKS